MPRRRSGFGIEGAAAEFEDVPFFWALIAAALVLVLLELAVPWAVSSFESGRSAFYSSLFLPVVRAIGILIAALIVLYGLKGAITRRFDRWLDARRSRRALEHAAGADGAGPRTWRELEDLVGESYHRLGYELVRRGGPRPDGGVDLELRRAAEKVLVQCKYWKTSQVGVRPVRELWGVVTSEGATRAIFVTTGGYTDEARAFARGNAIELIDAPGLSALVKAAAATSGRLEPTTPGAEEKLCPRCGRTLLIRTAKKGAGAGEKFWGCAGYPKCRYTEPVATAGLKP